MLQCRRIEVCEVLQRRDGARFLDLPVRDLIGNIRSTGHCSKEGHHIDWAAVRIRKVHPVQEGRGNDDDEEQRSGND